MSSRFIENDTFLNHFNDLRSIIKMPQNLSWSCILVVEERSVIYGNFILLPKLALVSANEYEKRFDELLNMGYAWINMSAMGIMDNAFIVEIGLPIQGRNAPRNKVSVNYSGPMIIDGKPLWDLSSKVKILE